MVLDLLELDGEDGDRKKKLMSKPNSRHDVVNGEGLSLETMESSQGTEKKEKSVATCRQVGGDDEVNGEGLSLKTMGSSSGTEKREERRANC
eukprot:12921733-Prorocentrum_lima.AAC.1